VALGVLAAPASAEIISHEYFEADPAEDLLFGATTPDGALPAAIETPSGVARAPDTTRSPFAEERAYGGGSTPTSQDSSFGLDADTTRPDLVGYDDPFNPAITPFKRLYAYDALAPNLELRVSPGDLTRVETVSAPRPGDDQFYGDLAVELMPNQPVRVASVGPGARVIAAHVHPPVPFELLEDRAENWFVLATRRERVRLTLQLAIARASFGSAYPEVSRARLPAVAPLPLELRAGAAEVSRHIGVGLQLTPRAAVEKLVAYYRAFAPSNELPKARDAVALYRELSLTQKGVCRHRTYGFFVTASAVGIPTRVVRNEAHAWVEVFDGQLWHRIDLGGAANDLELETRSGAFQHVPPPDPFPWPTGAESAAELLARTFAARAERERAAPVASAPRSAPSLSPSAALQETAPPRVPPALASLALNAPGGAVRRGALLQVAGRYATREGAPCAGARVDIALAPPAGERVPLGSLPTASDGAFAGSVTVRFDMPVGEYRIVASSPGTAECAASAEP
jgi:hypothetical protein